MTPTQADAAQLGAVGPVHVWVCAEASLDDPAVLEAALGVLKPAQRAALPLVRNGRAQSAWRQKVLGHAMCRFALWAAQPKTPPEAWALGRRASGQPFIADPSQTFGLQLTFSLSHTKGMVVCATCIGGDVGVDVEDDRRVVQVERIAERYYAAHEIAYIMQRPEGPMRRRAFLQLWTLKEAHLKAQGLGLQHLTRDLAFDTSALAVSLSEAFGGDSILTRCLSPAALRHVLGAQSRLMHAHYRVGVVWQIPAAHPGSRAPLAPAWHEGFAALTQ